MHTIAVIGAGPGLGLSIAKVFGGHGFQVALIARGEDHLGTLVSNLADAGITAAGFAADVADLDALNTALDAAVARFGAIDVLEFSPYAGLDMVDPVEVTVEDLRSDIGTLLYGAVTATRAVLPEMLRRGSGTLLFTMGGGAINPYPMLATVNAAQAALRNWAHNLHNVLADKGVHAATVVVNRYIGTTAPAPEIPVIAPDELARAYWELHTQHDRPEHIVT